MVLPNPGRLAGRKVAVLEGAVPRQAALARTYQVAMTMTVERTLTILAVTSLLGDVCLSITTCGGGRDLTLPTSEALG